MPTNTRTGTRAVTHTRTNGEDEQISRVNPAEWIRRWPVTSSLVMLAAGTALGVVAQHLLENGGRDRVERTLRRARFW